MSDAAAIIGSAVGLGLVILLSAGIIANAIRPPKRRHKRISAQFGPVTVTTNPEGTKEIISMALNVTKFDAIEGTIGDEKDSDGNVIGGAGNAVFSSSDAAVLGVEDLGGSYKATAVELGAADIVATFPDGFTAALNVTVGTGPGVSATFSDPTVTVNDAPAPPVP